MNRERATKSVLFLVKFFIIFGVLYALLLAADLSFLQEPIAGFEASLLGLGVEGSIVHVDGEMFDVTSQCTGLVSAITLAAVVFALRKPRFLQKAGLVALGAVLLLALNLARLYVVLVAGIFWGGGAAELMHVASWFVMSGAIIGVWYYSTKRIVNVKRFDGLI